MGKTRAEYQKEYRERKKMHDQDFLKKERQRTKQYKLPIKALSKTKQDELREKNKLLKSIILNIQIVVKKIDKVVKIFHLLTQV